MIVVDGGFEEFLEILNGQVADRCIEQSDGDGNSPHVDFREEILTEVMLETLEDLGHMPGVEICYFRGRIGRGIGKVNAWRIDEEERQLDLVTTVHRGECAASGVGKGEIADAFRRAVRVLEGAVVGHHEGMEQSSVTYDMMLRIHELQHDIDRVRVVLLAEGVAADAGVLDIEVDGREAVFEVWDLRRLFRAASSGLPYEPVEIDIAARTGRPIPCLRAPRGEVDYDVYLAILSGELLCSLYHEFGSRLLELNVRSFLQARGKVNKGIRKTLREEPEQFLAYNNGICATVEAMDLVGDDGSGLAIRIMRGLQVVNGGQTVASIHRAGTQDGVDLRDVHVQAKITIVQPAQIETLVPLISRYANSQNQVNEADFSANDPFHVKIQQLSERIWSPGEQSRWFYERARGQYQVAKAREATTPARRKAFEAKTPTSQKFDKVLLAKYVNSWGMLPHVVSRGGQKNFVAFMQSLREKHGEGWEPDADYYKQLVAQAIIFKRAEKIARQHKYPAYRANAITYTVAMMSYRTAGRLDLDEVWNTQDVSEAVERTMFEWMDIIYDKIIASAGERNVTEWCKKEDCWRHLQTLALMAPRELEAELSEGQPLPTVGDPAGRKKTGLTAVDRENIAHVMRIPAEEWVHICGWGARSGGLDEWQIGIAMTLAGYAATDWNKVPSKKQAQQGVRILQTADEEGGRAPVDD